MVEGVERRHEEIPGWHPLASLSSGSSGSARQLPSAKIRSQNTPSGTSPICEPWNEPISLLRLPSSYTADLPA